MLFDFKKSNQLFSILAPSLPMLLFGVLCAVLAGVSGLLAIWYIIQLIGGKDSAHWLIFASLCWCVSALLFALSAWLSHFSEAQFSEKLRRKVATHLTRLPAHQLANYKSDNLKRLLGDDITAMHHLIAHLPTEVANLLILPCLTVAFLLVETRLIALVVLLPGLIAAMCYLVVIPKLTAKQQTERFDVMAEITTSLNEYSNGVTTYRTYITNSGPLNQFKHATTHFIKNISSRIKRVSGVVAFATSMLQAVATFTIAYSVGRNWPIEELASLLFFSLAIVTPALKLGHGLDYVRAGKAAAKRIEDFLQTPVIPFGQKTNLVTGSGSLIVEQLSLQITAQLMTQRINFAVSSGTLLAISGVSGIGKSSLLRALSGFEPSYKGRILYQGEDCSPLSEQAWSRLALLLPQQLPVLDASVKENLALTQPNTTDEHYNNALEQAQLPISLSHSASLLSGGEKQRLHLARVFLSKAKVILLDEPTSALDEKTAMRCIKQLKSYAQTQQKIIIMVTHDHTLAAQANEHLYMTKDTLCGEKL